MTTKALLCWSWHSHGGPVGLNAGRWGTTRLSKTTTAQHKDTKKHNNKRPTRLYRSHPCINSLLVFVTFFSVGKTELICLISSDKEGLMSPASVMRREIKDTQSLEWPLKKKTQFVEAHQVGRAVSNQRAANLTDDWTLTTSSLHPNDLFTRLTTNWQRKTSSLSFYFYFPSMWLSGLRWL